MISENYPFADFDPYAAHLKTFFAQAETMPVEEGRRILSLMADSRIGQALATEGNLLAVQRMLGSEAVDPELKSAMFTVLARSLKAPKCRLQALGMLLPPLQAFVCQHHALDCAVQLLLFLGGCFSRNQYIPGETREYELLRAEFIDRGAFLLLLFADAKARLSTSFAQFFTRDWEKLLNDLNK